MKSTNLLRLVVLLALCGANTAVASEWEWRIAPYLWASDMSVDLSVNDEPALGGDLDFSDILDKLDMAFQIHAEGRKGRAGMFADFTYLNTGDSMTTSANPPLPGGTEVDVDMKTVLFEVGGSFRPVDEETPFELIAGIRVIGMDLDVDVELPTPPGGEFDFGSSDELVDVFAGARFMAPLGERFFFAVRGDVGTGDTDFTWNVQGTLGLQFGQQGRYAALLGYRHMEIELKETAEGVKIETDMTMSGPMAGFLFRF